MSITRRSLLQSAAAAGIGSRLWGGTQTHQFKVVDYHVHLGNGFTLNDAWALAKKLDVKFGIAEHAGAPDSFYPSMISNDDKLNAWIDFLENKPVYKGVQAEGLDWWKQFSKELVIRLDYALGDAMTFPERDGQRVRLWMKNEVHISDPQDFMNRYTAFNVELLDKSPLDIFAHPTYLPDALQKDFDALWTPARMTKVIDAAKRAGVAIEIDGEFRLPRPPFMEMAKKAGLKFSLGANVRPDSTAALDYCVEFAGRFGLKQQDMFLPAPQDKKPLLRRGFRS